VLALGLLIRKPLARVPENALKFAVGTLLSGFGLFWTAEGFQAPFPFGDWAILALVAAFGVFGLAMTAYVRFLMARAPAWT